MRTQIVDRSVSCLMLVPLIVASFGCPPARYSPNPVTALVSIPQQRKDRPFSR